MGFSFVFFNRFYILSFFLSISHNYSHYLPSCYSLSTACTLICSTKHFIFFSARPKLQFIKIQNQIHFYSRLFAAKSRKMKKVFKIFLTLSAIQTCWSVADTSSLLEAQFLNVNDEIKASQSTVSSEDVHEVLLLLLLQRYSWWYCCNRCCCCCC